MARWCDPGLYPYIVGTGQCAKVGLQGTLQALSDTWTGHHSRLDRLNISAPFGSPDYAAEELVAELGAAIAAASLDISPQPRADHAAYLAHWLDILNEDPKALFRIAAAAQRAVHHLHQLATETTGAEEVAQ